LLDRITTSGSHAPVVLMTSPIGILTRCAALTFPALRIAGICELPWATLLHVAHRTSASVSRLETRYVGVNHIGWFTSIRDESRDIVAEYARTLTDAKFPSREFVERTGTVPLKYLRLHYDADGAVRDQVAGHARAEALAELERAARLSYAVGDGAEVLVTLAKRPAPWYEQAVAPYIAMLAGGRRDEVVFLTSRNAGYVPWLAEDDFLEIPHTAKAGRLGRVASLSSVPECVAPVLERFVAYERLASAAVRSRNRDAVADSLAAHPWCEDSSDLRGLTERVTQDYATVASART
jgi:alpha-galactosidase/6-phospho-beta-glucosidase family protein